MKISKGWTASLVRGTDVGRGGSRKQVGHAWGLDLKNRVRGR